MSRLRSIALSALVGAVVSALTLAVASQFFLRPAADDFEFVSPAESTVGGAPGDTVTGEFVFRNRSDRYLVPAVRGASCACNESRFAPPSVKPGELFSLFLTCQVPTSAQEGRASMWVGAEGSKTLLRVRMRTVDGGEPYLLVAPQTLRVSDSDAAGEGSGLLDLRYRGDSCSGSPGEDLQLKGLTEARIEVVRVGTQQARVFAGRIRISLPRRVVEDTESVHLTGCGLPGVDLVLETATSGPE